MAPCLTVLLLLFSTVTSADLDVASRLTNVSVVEGRTAELPCDVTPPIAGDELRLVLWYYGTGGTPVYTYDARGRKSVRGSHWVDDSSLDAGRVEFQPDSQPASLRITRVQQSDQRLYRCRVDFLHSPTRNSRVNLTVIVPPDPPQIFYKRGGRVEGIAGPFREGQTVTFTCSTQGGWPLPNVTWWKGNSLLNKNWRREADGSVWNDLTVGPLTRDDLGSEYSCWATNHKNSPPRSATISIAMFLRPLSVQLMGADQALSAGVKYQLTCQSVGSRPASVVTWWLAGKRLGTTHEMVSEDGNSTTSVLMFTPSLQHVGQQLRCRSENPKMPAASLEDTRDLTIHYKPEVSVRMWSAMLDRGVREGDNVFMKCTVRADPPAFEIRWFAGSQPIAQRPDLKADVTNDTMTLRDVTTDASGQYSCEAVNAEGRARSAPAELDVQALPECVTDGPVTVHAARGEKVKVTCEVISNPDPFRFIWAQNVSGAIQDLPEGRITSLASTSVASFTPRRLLDFGSLLCWGDNLLGRQRQPCVFNIVLAERPSPLENCTLLNRTSSSLDLGCQPGFDGGMEQLFTLEVTESFSRRLEYNRTSALPRFHVTDLLEGENYTLTAYASNERGRSEVVLIQTSTLQQPAETGQRRSVGALFRMTPILGILIGIVGTLVLLAIAIVVTMRIRGHNDTKEGYPASAAVKASKLETNDSLKAANNGYIGRVEIDQITDPEEKYMAERLIHGPGRDLPRIGAADSAPAGSAYASLGRGEYTRVPSPKMPVYQGPYYTLPANGLGQRSGSSEASEGRAYDTAHSDTSTQGEAAPLMAGSACDRRESVV